MFGYFEFLDQSTNVSKVVAKYRLVKQSKVHFIYVRKELENQGCTKFAENSPMSKRKQNITNHNPILIQGVRKWNVPFENATVAKLLNILTGTDVF